MVPFSSANRASTDDTLSILFIQFIEEIALPKLLAASEKVRPYKGIV